jgi:hypothetical protein
VFLVIGFVQPKRVDTRVYTEMDEKRPETRIQGFCGTSAAHKAALCSSVGTCVAYMKGEPACRPITWRREDLQGRPFKGLIPKSLGTNEGSIPPSGRIKEVGVGKDPRVWERFGGQGCRRPFVCADNVLKSFY